jgi:hypothetical protein
LLHPRDESDPARLARERYAVHYSTARLRELASKIKGSRHGDLWRQFQLLANALSGDKKSSNIRENLALPALGSFLWNPANTAALNDAELANHDFLGCLRNLGFTRQGKVLRPVDYQNLGAEELGGVYESLLGLTPQLSADGARFAFAEFAGSERKTSGSYYTPDSLVQCLLDSALDPVVEEAIKGKIGQEAEKAILDLKICDPAVGSGHFLVGAAHRLARHLARVRAHAQGESEPSPLLYQHALRNVIGHCLYGVDINPMAAELCRVSLWLEALEPGKPLSFLDHHIRVGNSLLGTTPELLTKGIPDEAFNPIEGDDKKFAAALKKRNQMSLPLAAEGEVTYGDLADKVSSLDSLEDDSIESVHEKEESYNRLNASSEYRHAKLLADAWCAAFVWKKRKDAPQAVTEDILRRLRKIPASVTTQTIAEINRLSSQHQFFHWHLAFPEVFAKGGVDSLIGNPPWEMMELSEKEYFAQLVPAISQAQSARLRQSLINELEYENPHMFESYNAAKRANSGFRLFVQKSGIFPTSSTGRINLYPLFVERATALIALSGSAGLIVPSAISMDAYNAPLFSWLVETRRLASLFDFDNTAALFPAVDSRYRFCLLTLVANHGLLREMTFCYFAHSVEELGDNARRICLSHRDILVFSPNTLAPPMLLNSQDMALARLVYGRFGVLCNHKHPSDNNWSASIQRMLSLSDPGDLFRLANELAEATQTRDWTRLYCGKAIHQYDH